jgi:hypothetical protein
MAVGIDPFADRVTRVGRLNLPRPVSPVGEDATAVVGVVDQDVGGLR